MQGYSLPRELVEKIKIRIVKAREKPILFIKIQNPIKMLLDFGVYTSCNGLYVSCFFCQPLPVSILRARETNFLPVCLDEHFHTSIRQQ